MKSYSLKKAAELLHHRGGGYGLKLDIENADDFPIRCWKAKNGRWQGLNELTLPVLAAYYESKGAAVVSG